MPKRIDRPSKRYARARIRRISYLSKIDGFIDTSHQRNLQAMDIDKLKEYKSTIARQIDEHLCLGDIPGIEQVFQKLFPTSDYEYEPANDSETFRKALEEFNNGADWTEFRIHHLKQVEYCRVVSELLRRDLVELNKERT
jgi:hypothetical protein